MLKTFAVIGDPIHHSMSPNIHNAAFRELGMESTYIAYRVPTDQLEEGIESLKRIGISGFNVTIPHKTSVMKFLDKTDQNCSLVGAANTITNYSGTLKGYNTDMDGFLAPIIRKGIGVAGRSVMLLGAGGAARAIVAGFARQGAASITIANRTVEKARKLCVFAERLGMRAVAASLASVPSPSEYDFIVNSTSIGMAGQETPVDTSQIRSDSVVYDIVYAPMKTSLIAGAKRRGAMIIFGYEMLLGQAALAFEIWHGRKAPYDAMKRALLGAGT